MFQIKVSSSEVTDRLSENIFSIFKSEFAFFRSCLIWQHSLSADYQNHKAELSCQS